jgi:hypothetical protein
LSRGQPGFTFQHPFWRLYARFEVPIGLERSREGPQSLSTQMRR